MVALAKALEPKGGTDELSECFFIGLGPVAQVESEVVRSNLEFMQESPATGSGPWYDGSKPACTTP